MWAPVFKTGGFNRSPTPPIRKGPIYGRLSSSVYQFVYQFARSRSASTTPLDVSGENYSTGFCAGPARLDDAWRSSILFQSSIGDRPQTPIKERKSPSASTRRNGSISSRSQYGAWNVTGLRPNRFNNHPFKLVTGDILKWE